MKCKVENNELKAGCGWGKAEVLCMKTQKKNSLLMFVRSFTITLMNRLTNVLTEGTLTKTSGVF